MSWDCLSKAPIIKRVFKAEQTSDDSQKKEVKLKSMHLLVSVSGASMRSSSMRSWPRHRSCNMLDVRLHRSISGSPETAIELKASSV